MTSPNLDIFFAEMAELLAGRKIVAQCEAVLGQSPSGSQRFGGYAMLVDRQQRGVVDSFFRAAMVAAASWDARRCDELRQEFLQAHPPTHWSPSEVAAPFADYLEAQGAPVDVIELADFARTRHQVLTAPLADGIAGLAVRHYTHAVKEFTIGVELGEILFGRPAATHATWLFGRHREHANLVLVSPSLPALVALQLIEDQVWTNELPDVDRSKVAHEVHFLAAQGLLSDAAVAVVHTCL